MRYLLRLMMLLLALCFLIPAVQARPALAGSALPEADEPEDDGAGRAAEEPLDDGQPDWTDELGEGEGAADFADGLEVYFLDLGRVDGILIRCDGETSFIDVGYRKNAVSATKYLKYLGVSELDSYIASHAHSDHVGGASRIIGTFRPKKIYLNRKQTLNAILEEANKSEASAVRDAKSIVLKPGDSFAIGSAQVRCLGPLVLEKCGTGAYKENYNSLVLRMDYRGRSFLFTGDSTDNVLRSINKAYPGELDVDVFKNPHHNGRHDEDVLKFLSPKITVVCTANENQPDREYQKLVKACGSALYITGSKKHGNVAIICRDDAVEVRTGYPLTDIELSPVPALYTGQEYTLAYDTSPGSTSKPEWISWKTSDRGVVRVSNGRVKAIAPGTATVTATTLNGITASVDIEVKDTVVQIAPQNVQIAVGESKKLKAKILPKAPKGVTGEWISADPSVLLVMPNGEIIGAKEGTTQVIARLSNGVEAACEVKVYGIMVDSIELDRKEVTMKVGDLLKLEAVIKPIAHPSIELDWASSNEKVVWVDMEGNVTAVGKGTAKIGVRSSNGKLAVCTIKVK
ncbi:MAG: Ig-like domain-containing protein [Clostridia bacterium]|nr:Ig-like domain-containing protein [Clostridia bacterium]